MASFNRVILMGNLTRDPEVRFTASGTAVSDLGLAVNDRVKNAQGEWVDQVTFVDVTVWGRTAENCGKFLAKGRGIMVEGRLKLDTWETKEGDKRSKLQVVADKVQFLPQGGGSGSSGGDSSRSSSPSAASASTTSAPPSAPAADDDEDLPF